MSPCSAPDAAEGLRVLGGNEPLPLTGQHAWFIRSGSIAIFAKPEKATDGGLRRFLFSVGAGDTILWPAGENGGGTSLTAVPTERCELIPAPLTEEAAAIAAGDVDAMRRFAA